MNLKKIIRALLCAADGSEEIETVNIANTLVRGGINVILAKVFEINDLNNYNLLINCERGTKIIADKSFDDCKDESWEIIILPGGKLGAVKI